MIYTYYDASTGEIKGIVDTADAAKAEQYLQGHAWLPGEFSFDRYYIDNNQPVEKPSCPIDDKLYNFSWQSKTWEIDLDKTSEAMRIQRNQLLTIVDRVNPIWYNSLTTEQQAELATYRQALLDVPAQVNFPLDINWPAKPAWL